MRLIKARFALAATLLGALTLSTTAIAGGWFSSDDSEVTLAEVLRHPEKHREKEFVLTVYFNAIGENFNQYYTEFHKEGHGNFAAWPIDARVYDKRDFQRCYPHFYAKLNTDLWEDIKDLDRFDVIEVRARVKHVYKGRPYFEIFEVDTVGYGMDEDEIKAAIRAQAHYLAGNYSRAQKLYRREELQRGPHELSPRTEERAQQRRAEKEHRRRRAGGCAPAR
ncbi:MAG: hypothetical protein ACYTGZ_17450 [Planctomycetota bacterium]|jgi:hypothetical protein